MTKKKPKVERKTDVLTEALVKIGEKNEDRLAAFIPAAPDATHAMHHRTFRTKLSQNRNEILSLLDEYILKTKEPVKLPASPRKARGTTKKTVRLPKEKVEDLIQKLSAHKEWEIIRSLEGDIYTDGELNRTLRQAIKNWEIRDDLWIAFSRRAAEKAKKK